MGVAALYARTRRKLLEQVPTSVWRRLIPRSVLPLYYHMVSDRVLPHLQTTPDYKDGDQFEADVAWLQSEGAVVDYARLAAHVENGAPVPRDSFHITFDDGFRECFDVVRPILLRHGTRATFFVTTDLIDNRQLNWAHLRSVCLDRALRTSEDRLARVLNGLGSNCGVKLTRRRELCAWLRTLRQHEQNELTVASDLFEVDAAQYLADYRPYLTTAQIAQLTAEGFTIGAHALRHYLLGDLEDAETEHEIVESCRIIRDLTGAQQVPFAFPFHGDGVDRRLLAALRRRHDFIGLIFDTRRFKPDIPDVIQRVPADSTRGSTPGKSNLPLLLRRAYSSA